MVNKNKTRIPLNRKPIDEIDGNETKDIILNSKDQDDATLDKSDIDSTPFQTTDVPTPEENPFAIEEDNDDINLEDNSPFTNTTFEDATSVNNPFTAEDIPDLVETIDEANSSTNTSNSESIALEVDPDIPYFFVFGSSTAGKSVMLSGLLYYIQTGRIGILNSLSQNDKLHHRKGDYILSQMTKRVRDGKFIAGTKTLDATNFVFPTEINLEFQPHDKQSMPFCLLEMAGEDLSALELRDEGKFGGDFDERINAYLKHPDCNMNFICVVDVDTPENSEDLINEFLRYIRKIGHINNPLLITVNKWDKVAAQYEKVDEYIKDKLPILHNNLFDTNRDISYMKFSIGDVTSDPMKGDSYKFKPEDSKKLLNWMYSIATGQSLDKEVKKSFASSIINSIKKILTNG